MNQAVSVATHDRPQHFASDNYSGICPEAWAAMADANAAGHAPAYGDDPWTRRAADAIRELFETDCDVFFVFNGTAANSLALASLCRSYQSVVCTATAHVEIDECGAPEFFSGGSKLLLAPAPDGKLTPAAIRALATGRRPIHFPQARAATITQSTETGRVYTIEEIGALSATCRELGLKFHMDGARFANACASLRASAADVSWRAGIDVLCFGGTKNGMASGEAVIFFDRTLAVDFEYRCKQAGQLASKMRFAAAPWAAMLETGAWLRNAAHANRCAQRLAAAVADLQSVELLFPPEANAVFLRADEPVLDALRAKGWRFYTFIGGGARFMCGWDTDPAAVDQLAADMREAVAIGDRTSRYDEVGAIPR